nr:MAG TPA: helix-turn-helix domain protein [Caudoviricetes sp.]
MDNLLPIVEEDFLIKKFTVKLKVLRKEKKYTQERLASILGVDIKTYRSWEKGTLPKTIDLFNLANILDCDVDYLLGRINTETHLKDYINKYYSLSPEAFDKLLLLSVYQSSKGDNYHKKIANELSMILEYLISTTDGNFMLDQIRQYVVGEKSEPQKKHSYLSLLNGVECNSQSKEANWWIMSDIIDSLSKMCLYFTEVKASANAAKFSTPVSKACKFTSPMSKE